MRTTAAGRSSQSHAASTLTAAAIRSGGTGASAATRVAHPGPERQVGEPRYRPPGLGRFAGRELALDVDAE